MTRDDRDRMIRVLRGIGRLLKEDREDGLSQLAYYLAQLIESRKHVQSDIASAAIAAADSIGWPDPTGAAASR